jgi:hypothetical protein
MSPVEIEVNSALAKRWPNLYVKLDRTVCIDCNNGWMSDLEKQVKPYLGPMLVNEHSVDLDAEQQRDLARWALTKILLLELSIRQQHPHRRCRGSSLGMVVPALFRRVERVLPEVPDYHAAGMSSFLWVLTSIYRRSDVPGG